jgi:hypothetical protein
MERHILDRSGRRLAVTHCLVEVGGDHPDQTFRLVPLRLLDLHRRRFHWGAPGTPRETGARQQKARASLNLVVSLTSYHNVGDVSDVLKFFLEELA